jgi:hypothetical protein
VEPLREFMIPAFWVKHFTITQQTCSSARTITWTLPAALKSMSAGNILALLVKHDTVCSTSLKGFKAWTP